VPNILVFCMEDSRTLFKPLYICIGRNQSKIHVCLRSGHKFLSPFLCRFKIYYMLVVEDLIATLYTTMIQYCSDLFRIPKLSQLQRMKFDVILIIVSVRHWLGWNNCSGFI
jgi:hypothetical protein